MDHFDMEITDFLSTYTRNFPRNAHIIPTTQKEGFAPYSTGKEAKQGFQNHGTS